MDTGSYQAYLVSYGQKELVWPRETTPTPSRTDKDLGGGNSNSSGKLTRGRVATTCDVNPPTKIRDGILVTDHFWPGCFTLFAEMWREDA